jgi:hypothetical protein
VLDPLCALHAFGLAFFDFPTLHISFVSIIPYLTWLRVCGDGSAIAGRMIPCCEMTTVGGSWLRIGKAVHNVFVKEIEDC